MTHIDKKNKIDIKFGTSDKTEWLKNHTMSEEQKRQLIYEKYQRALKYLELSKKHSHYNFD
jgi:hypothetical protein